MIIEPGTDILNYRITEVLGHGGMGRVYKAIHLSLERIVAIKAIHHRLLRNEKMIERFYHEARIQAKLNHPNIVTVYDFFEYQGNYFIVMEFVEGESVSRIISHQGPFELKLGITVFRHILDGISYAHQNSVIHKDIKTSNFLLTPRNVKITDFGIAQIIGDEDGKSSGEGIIGTPKYMSPEMILGRGEIDHRTDIYSLGITLYEFITGRVPFGGKNVSDMEIRRNQVETKPLAPKEFNNLIPNELQNIILKAIEKDPDKRYQSIDEFIEAMDKLKFSKPAPFISKIIDAVRKTESPILFNTAEPVKTETQESKTVPESEEKPLKGTLEVSDFATLLSTHHYRASSGCLHINSDTDLYIYFLDGFVQFVDCRDSDLLLGRLLVANQHITEQEQQNVIDFSRSTGLKTGEALIKMGKLSPHELSNILELQMKLKLLNGFRFRKGSFRFDSDINIDSETFFRIDPIQIIYDAIDSYILLEETELDSYDLSGNIHPSDKLMSKISSITLSSPRQYKLIQMIREPVPVSDIITKSPIDRPGTIKLLKFLSLAQLIRIEKSSFTHNSYRDSAAETVLLTEEQIENELKNLFKNINAS